MGVEVNDQMSRWRFRKARREAPTVQRSFAFHERSRQIDRWFKRAIALMTLLAIALMVAAVPKARALVQSTASRTSRSLRQAIGIPIDRAEIDAEWARTRRQGIDETRREFTRVFAEVDPANQRLMTFAGNDPATGLLRWGNFNMTLLLPSTIFEADDHGRSYRLRPNTHAVWLRNLSIRKIPLTFFLVPDGPGLDQATIGTGAVRVEGATQTTNSWGLRGPEPDLEAPVRGIVLGDSFMQGLFVGDDDTPPACLARELESELKTRVSILNTGHLGYSTEQEFYTLKEYAERFHPSFVVLSLFANDFGEIYEVLAGKGDWNEGKYWIDEINGYCRQRGITLVTITAPLEIQITARPLTGNYPGLIVNLLDAAGANHVDATAEFANTHLRLMNEGEKAGKRPMHCPLFNGHIGDAHFSRIGSECWARAVARRLRPIIERSRSQGAS